MTIPQTATPNYQNSTKTWIGLVVLIGLLAALFFEIVSLLVKQWLESEEYSHGIMIPFIAAFLIWQKQNELAELNFKGAWLGLVPVIVGLLLYMVGELATLYIIVEYSLLIILMGGAWAVTGNRIFSKIWVPLFFLFFAIPLPNFLYQGLSTKLQLISSWLGVSFIRLCDISVLLEGNVIDLGAMRLQVAEACNGLRYLFPLTSVAFMCAYFYQEKFWKRAVIFLSSIPITIFMNSFRIGAIGVMVEYWGKSMAEGFLHDFEGWIVFMGCTAILLGEMWLLAQIGGNRRPLREVFGLVFPDPWPSGTRFQDRQLPPQTWAVGGLLVLALAVSPLITQREEIVPARAMLNEFPLQLGQWNGQRQAMEKIYIDTLKFDDYILADYASATDPGVINFYSAYYASQRKGESIHSPRSCLPTGGWEMQTFETVIPQGFENSPNPLRVNRVVIQKGDVRQLVYYWFRQRGRNITDEYLAKFYLFWDALTKNRSDGALIRLTTPVPLGSDLAQADRRLTEFLQLAEPQFRRYIAD